MKRAIILFWKGLTGILTGVANWITIVLGMHDDSKFGKCIRRIVGASFAFIMLVMACGVGYVMCGYIYEKLKGSPYMDDSYYEGQYLSRNATYYSREGQIDGFVETRDGKKTVTDIHWISKPLGDDSLVCYSNGKKRGYFNMLTGEVAIEPKFNHAWVFSDGLAAVDDNGWMKFIDANGNVVIDLRMPYLTGADGYVFHQGLCVVHSDRRDKFGLIDKKGNWVLKAQYDEIYIEDSLLVVGKGEMQSVISANMKTVIPMMKAKFSVCKGVVTATMDNHSIRTYSTTGRLLDDFQISNVFGLMYDTDEIRYTTAKSFDEEGNMTGETEEAEPTPYQSMASCKKYEAETGWFGLMSPTGKVITPPVYSDITAIGYDVYLCKRDDYRGEVLNGNGERIK